MKEQIFDMCQEIISLRPRFLKSDEDRAVVFEKHVRYICPRCTPLSKAEEKIFDQVRSPEPKLLSRLDILTDRIARLIKRLLGSQTLYIGLRQRFDFSDIAQIKREFIRSTFVTPWDREIALAIALLDETRYETYQVPTPHLCGTCTQRAFLNSKGYARSKLKGFPNEMITPELIEIKQVQLKIKRICNRKTSPSYETA